jgi:AraC family transcriptional regulator, regulatory protein of adaptative response / methylated-DNA-[protein]-cysteine methyltransferase
MSHDTTRLFQENIMTSTGTEAMKVSMGRSSLGLVLVAETAKGIRAIQLGDDAESLREELRDRFPAAEIGDGDAATAALLQDVTELIEKPGTNAMLPLDIRGTGFQQTVWRALREIPAGSTESYTAVARRIGMPRAVRAVAHACAENPLAVVVPCHRVVRSDGRLAGYRWGIERKRILLEREAAAV